jgi:hypothetical protein
VPTRSRSSTGLPRLTRRAALASLVVAAGSGVAACTPDRGPDRRRNAEPGPVEPEVDPDVALATAALESQTAVVDLIRRTRDRHPSLSVLVAPVLAAHEAHAALLAEASAPHGAPSASPARSDVGRSPVPQSPVPRTPVPGTPGRALRRLVVAEQELTTAVKQQAFKARSGAFARVLGSMAAASAQNAVVLGSRSGARRAS